MHERGIKKVQTYYHGVYRCDPSISMEEKYFSFEGCKHVYLVLNENGLFKYYELEKNPVLKAKRKSISRRLEYLKDE